MIPIKDCKGHLANDHRADGSSSFQFSEDFDDLAALMKAYEKMKWGNRFQSHSIQNKGLAGYDR
ncbi:hypothetical protein HYPDE_23198 [Hyphomicrobium denitrificans 1NES1]|uniref:Uncharacterized protein n=1 Tax=Hyphomicrobium denitrificans 1NES1 TaxID=670307 RepID=N0B705_9HYPH|nr:hypothetical protein HYPDE_23198 [Hyphomicrobium denitrificans 1NES1]